MGPETLAIAMTIGFVVYSITLHELAHAHASTYFGDPTPGRHGRLTWNPIVQLDGFSSVLLPIISYILMSWPIGWAYCPIDPTRYKHPLRDNALVALAGPVANFAIAGFFLGLLWIPGFLPTDNITQYIAFGVCFFNVFLGCFNLMPFPGLDGYGVLRPFLPLKIRMKADEVRRYGWITMMMILILGPYLFNLILPFELLLRLFNAITPDNVDVLKILRLFFR